jgi:hypothetical protein
MSASCGVDWDAREFHCTRSPTFSVLASRRVALIAALKQKHAHGSGRHLLSRCRTRDRTSTLPSASNHVALIASAGVLNGSCVTHVTECWL